MIGQNQSIPNNYNNKYKNKTKKKDQNNSEIYETGLKLKYDQLEKYFTIFLSSLSLQEVDLLFKIILKLLSLTETTPKSLYTPMLVHNLESKEELKKIAFFDSFKWNIINWKTLFLEEV